MFLRQTSFSLSNYVSTCRVIQSREANDGWTDDWRMLKDRRGEGVGGGWGGVKEVLNGLGSKHQRAHDKFRLAVWLQVAPTVFRHIQRTFHFVETSLNVATDSWDGDNPL